MLIRNKITIPIIIFVTSYVILLILWVFIKPYYGKFIGVVSSELAAATTDTSVKKSSFSKENIKITFSLPYLMYKKEGIKDVEIKATIGISSFAFNIPLTFSLIFALFPLIKWKKTNLLEAALLLIIIHLLFAYSYFCLYILYSLSKTGVKALTPTKQMFWEFVWSFTDNMIIRFEPFLLAVYIWLRNAKGFKIY